MNAQVKPTQSVRILDDVEVTKFTPVILTALETDLKKAMESISSKYGINLTFAYGKTNEHSIAARVTGYIGSEPQEGVNPNWVINFHKHAHRLGLTSDDYGRTLKNLTVKNPDKHIYRVVGIAPKTLDLIVETPTKKYFRISKDDVVFIDQDVQVDTVDEVQVKVVEPVEAVKSKPIKEVEVVKSEPIKQSAITELLDVYDDNDDIEGLIDVSFDSDQD